MWSDRCSLQKLRGVLFSILFLTITAYSVTIKAYMLDEKEI